MEILYENSNIPQQVSLILGFFDGVHAGHRDVIKNTPSTPKVLVTFSSSPAEFFGKKFKYIYPREFNYRLLKNLGVDYIFEQDFSKIANLTAEEYLKKLLNLFKPTSITTGFNHTFGTNRQGNSLFLEKKQGSFKYFCTLPSEIDGEIVSSTKIKEFLSAGEIEKANKFLASNFVIESTVIEGRKLGRELGFPTANLDYPSNIIKLPYGVYKVNACGLPAVMNWGIKPTFESKEGLEVHIPNFECNLYGKSLQIEIISKLRDEKKFDSVENLKLQIEKDVNECLK